MKYIVYRVTNKVNGKFYIGAHSTNNVNDGYFGSGKGILRALKKYKIENFTKDILFVFDNKEDMFDKEAEIVTKDFVKRKDNYNMVTGGDISPTYQHTDESRKRVSKQFKGKILSDEHKKKISETKKKVYHPYRGKELTEEHKEKNRQAQIGRKHSKETRQKLSDGKKGEKNPNYGKTFSKEYRNKLSNAHKGQVHPEETKQKMSSTAKGNQYSKGHKQSDEHKKKLLEARQRVCIHCGEKVKRLKRASDIYIHRYTQCRQCLGMKTFAK